MFHSMIKFFKRPFCTSGSWYKSHGTSMPNNHKKVIEAII